MAKNKKEALRAARAKRIASRKESTQSNSEVNEAPAPGSTTPAVLTASVSNPHDVPRNAEVDLIGFNDPKDPFWILTANGRPVAEIRLSDQEDPAAIASMFMDENYAETVRGASSEFSVAEIIERTKARPYTASVSENEAFQQIEARLTKENSLILREAKANLRDSMHNMLNLVVLAQTNNFLRENPLKEELCDRLTACGIDTPTAVAVIEASFQAKAAEHFDACFRQAAKWQDLSTEALAEVEEQIRGLGHRMPTVEDDREIPSKAAGFNVALHTYTASAGNEEPGSRDEMAARLGSFKGYRR